jgi:hypothetical protein
MVADPNPSRRTPAGVTDPLDSSFGERLQARLVLVADDLEDGEMPPTAVATRVCQEMLFGMADQLPAGQLLPFPHLSSGGQGDLSCEWRVEKRLVLLFISAQGKSCLYQMDSGGVDVVTRNAIASPSSDELVTALEWLED